MKKLFFVAIVALAALISCSRENDARIKEQHDVQSFTDLMNEIE